MSLKFNSDQQRIEGSGLVQSGAWINATYQRVGTTVTVVKVGHGLKSNEKVYLDFTSGGATDGNYEITRIDDDNFTVTDTASGTITAGNTCSYRVRRSLVLSGTDIVDVRTGTGAAEKSSLIVKQDSLGDVRIGIGNVDPEFELDVDGQIRTNRSIISDTAQIINLDIGTIVNPQLNLRAPNLVNFLDADVTSPTYNTTFYPTADTPPISDQSRRIATTDFVYKVATNDTGGRVYVSSTIGSDDNDGRSAARPLRTVKKAAQIAYGLQKAVPDPSDEYVSIIVSGGEYLEDNPISLPRNCSLIGDNLRRVIIRPQNADRHMVKASNETYINGVVFRDRLQNSNDPNSTTISTWKYAFVFDDKQRLYYEPEVKQIPGQPGEKFRGANIWSVTFNSHTGNNTTLTVGQIVKGHQSSTIGTVTAVNFTGPQASPYSTGNVTVTVTSGEDENFNIAERLHYDSSAGAIITDLTDPNVDPHFVVADTESLRPELEVISNQIYQHTVDSEVERLKFTTANAANDRLTVTAHGLFTGAAVNYQDDGNTGGIPGLVNNSNHYVRVIDADTIELYDTWTNAVSGSTTGTQGIRDILSGTQTGTHLLFSSKVQYQTNEIYIERHGLTTGDGVYYRADKMGAIGGLVDNSQYFVYVVNSHYIQLAATEANAVAKNASGDPTPTIISLTSNGSGWQRFDLASKLLSIDTIDTTLTTQQTYNGTIVNLISTDFHDYEVGQEVQIYGVPYSNLDLGTPTGTYTQTGSTLNVTITNVGSTEGSALWSNLAALGECGIYFDFVTGGAFSKSYHIDRFDTGSTVTVPTAGLGYGNGAYDSSTNTIRFTLLAPPSSTTLSGSVTLRDNLGDLNGRKYITHRIERADGYSLQFVVRGTFSKFANENPTGDQTVISSSNYLLTSLSNSPYTFTKTSFTHRYRDAAEAIKANQSYIAEEAYGFVKSHHTNSVTKGSTLTLKNGEVYSSISGNSRSGTYSVSGSTLTATVPLGHALWALQSYTFNTSGTLPNASRQVADVTGETTFTVDLGATTWDGDSGNITYTTPLPHITPNSPVVSDKAADASSLILANKTLIAQSAVGVARFLDTRADASDTTKVTNLQNCTRQAAGHGGTGAGSSGGFNIGPHIKFGSSASDASVDTIDFDTTQIQAFWVSVIRGNGSNGGDSPEAGEDLLFEYSNNAGGTWTQFGSISYADTSWDTLKTGTLSFPGAAKTSATRIRVKQQGRDSAEATGDNWGFCALGFDNTSTPVFPANGEQNCADDVEDFLESVAYNLTYGGNDQVFDAANYYVTGAHIVGEEDASSYVFEIALEMVTYAIRNQPIDNRYTQFSLNQFGAPEPTQVFDNTITLDVQNPSCQTELSTITTFFTLLDQAIGSTGNPGNLNGITRTYASGDQQCIDDVVKVLKAYQYDLRYQGNSKTAEAVNKYIASGAIQHITNEVQFSRQVFAKAHDLALDALRNNLGAGTFTQIAPVANGSVTIDPTIPACANVASTLLTLADSFDNALDTATAISSITYPEVVITELGASSYNFPLLSDNLDLPIIEASPYIQNSSLISFLGGSGCEIDGSKVATPNVPRPGLKLNAQGQTVAQFEPQGKSMVASAFTIISFGGTAYNILNDGYTQLVSVFAIFCQDGILVQSGGYASVTNSASNFGTYALRATGFRSEPYAFDIGQVTSVTNQVDGNGVPTGRQILRVAGTTLTNTPVEDYIIKFDDATNTNPATEFFILKTTLVSGAPGTQVTADIEVNASLDLTDTASGTVYSYANGNLSGYLTGKTIKFHRPSVCNSSSHTWEYSGSGNTYAALPQNGGVGRGSAYEASEEAYGQVYTSGTNEFGDFKVGNFVTIFNRTGAISFVGTVAISELTSIKIVGGNITITGFSSDDNLGGAFASDSLLPTQAAVKDYISNNLGPYLNQPFSTNAVPSALVQLTSNGKINIDQIPALRPFSITSVASTAERLAIVDAQAGDIAIETSTQTFNVAPTDVNTSTDEITITGHGLATAEALVYTQGTTGITGLATGNTYYVISVDANTIKLAVSEVNANANTAINLQSQGSGTQVFQTQGVAVSYILENDLDSQFLAFDPNSGYSFSVNDVIEGSSTGARGSVTGFEDGVVHKIDIVNGGGGYLSAPSVTIDPPGGSGTTAVANATITNGIVTAITVTTRGSGYFSQPTVTIAPPNSGTAAVGAAQVEGRVLIDIANNIKFDAGDFILDFSLTTEGSGSYGQGGTTDLIVTESNHGLSTNDIVYLDFTSGSAADGFFSVTVNNSNEYQVTTAIAATTAGNVNRKRVIDLSRVVNTSGSDAANWTQLTSTNIDATNIVSGTIDTDRLASRGTANSNTFLRGDNSWEYAVQSMKPETGDAMLVSGSITDSTYIEDVTIVNGGSGYTDGTYQSIPMDGGNVLITNDGVARATYIVSGGVITSVTVTDSGTGYNQSFAVVIPSELGGGSNASLTANKGTVNRVFGNISIDIKKGDALTPGTGAQGTVYGNYGVFRLYKDTGNQGLTSRQAGGQDAEGGFIVTNAGEVRIDQGPGSELNADRLDGNHAGYFEDAGSLLTGVIDPARLANTTYNISISGVAATATALALQEVPTSNPAPSAAAEGLQTHLRNNTATGLSDGGTQHGVMTFRRETARSASTQLGFTDNNNLYIRGNSGNQANYGNWAKIWSAANDGSNSGLDADVLDGYQGLYYQTPRNLVNIPLTKDSQDGGFLAHDALPEVLGTNKHVFENFYVDADGSKYDLIISGFHASAASGGNLNNSGTYTMYSDVGATNNIGSFVIDSGGITEGTDNTGVLYTRVRGTATFTGNATSRDIYVMGPNPGSKWTVTSSNHITSGSAQIFGVNDNATGAGIELGRTSVSSVPTFDFRSSGQAGDYDVQLRVSGGNSTNGNGTLRINAGDVTINGNTVWHAGNDGSSSQLDAHYLDGYTQTTAATANTIVRRDGSANITANDYTGDQLTLTNTGTSIISFADGNGFTLGKATTNVATLRGKQNSSVGYIRFGTDSNSFGWNGTSLSYNNVYFRDGELGIGVNNPSAALDVLGDGVFGNTSGGNRKVTVLSNSSSQAGFEAYGGGQATGYLYIGQSAAYGGGIAYNGDNSPAAFGSEQGDDITFYRRNNGTDSRVMKYRYDSSTVHFFGQIRSRVSTGTAPLQVDSTTKVTNLNADLLDGYSALDLPYLQGTVNTWINDAGGQPRFYFGNNSHTYFRTGDDFFWRNDSDQTFASWDQGGRCHFHEPGSNSIQSTYRVQVTGDSGLNINASEGLSSGQKSTVLRATGDKQWIDTYGIFKRNRQTVGENVNVNNGDNCMSAGPITINNGTTVTINSGGYWSIV